MLLLYCVKLNEKHKGCIFKTISSVLIATQEHDSEWFWQPNYLWCKKTDRKTCTPSLQTSFIWRRHALLCICMYFCYPQANKCLSSDTCKWKRFLLPEMPRLMLTKGAQIHEIPKTSVEQSLCAVCACRSRVLMLGLVEALGGVCCSKGYYLSAANYRRWELSRAAHLEMKERR